jgi:hypothetical protein
MKSVYFPSMLLMIGFRNKEDIFPKLCNKIKKNIDTKYGGSESLVYSLLVTMLWR